MSHAQTSVHEMNDELTLNPNNKYMKKICSLVNLYWRVRNNRKSGYETTCVRNDLQTTNTYS